MLTVVPVIPEVSVVTMINRFAPYPKSKSLFSFKCLTDFFRRGYRDFIVFVFFLESAKFREITSKSSFLQEEQAFLQN